MLGAIIGDIVGSRFEWSGRDAKGASLLDHAAGNNIKTKEFEFLTYRCAFTNDSVMSLAIAKALLDCGENYDGLGDMAVAAMREIGRPYPDCGYGGMFRQWVYSDNPAPYNSFGSGPPAQHSWVG